MKKILFALFLISTIFINSCISYSEPVQQSSQLPQRRMNIELSIFDNSGREIAYLDDQTLDIYLWEGEPVAFLMKTNELIIMFGYNGKHLGWLTLDDKLFRTIRGEVVGFLEGASHSAMGHIIVAGEKGRKHYNPNKQVGQNVHHVPPKLTTFSNITFIDLLLSGSGIRDK